MRRLLLAIMLSAAVCGAQELIAGPLPQPHNFSNQSPAADNSDTTQITVPAGTTVPLALTRAIWSKTAAPGETVYAETVFPVTIDNQMAIPAGTYAQGQIDAISRPVIFSPHAQIQIHFTKLIFANGYTVMFGDTPSATAVGASATQPATNSTNDDDVIPAVPSDVGNAGDAGHAGHSDPRRAGNARHGDTGNACDAGHGDSGHSRDARNSRHHMRRATGGDVQS